MKKKFFICFFCLVIMLVCFLYNDYDQKSPKSRSIKYNGNKLMISIDGTASNNLPTSGNYYLADYDCENSSTVLTWDSINYKLNVSNGTKKGGVSCYLNFETYPKLSNMEIGSYVSYTGNNGCSGDACSGQNANYESDAKMGYCYNSNYQFIDNGWKIAYFQDGSTYLIASGALECMCTNSDGTTSNSSCSSNETAAGAPTHLANLNNSSLKYCNKNYVYGGVCNANSVWNINAQDFKNITGSTLSSSSCYTTYSNISCGYNNDLLDNGGLYWIATPYSASSNNVLFWTFSRYVYRNSSSALRGVRPVIRLDSNIVVTGGKGTYDNPYTIANNTFWINNGATTVNQANKANVSLTLTSPNATKMCISTNTSVCTNYVDFDSNYILDWTSEAAGEKVVYVYFKNSNGTIIATANRSITLENT